MALQVELALEGIVDRLDELPQRLEQPVAGPWRLALVGRPQDPHALGGQDRLGLGIAVALVSQDDQPGPLGHEPGFDVQQLDQDLPLVSFGVGQREGNRQAVQGTDQVQPQPPEVAGVRAAVAVGGPPAKAERRAVSIASAPMKYLSSGNTARRRLL